VSGVTRRTPEGAAAPFSLSSSEPTGYGEGEGDASPSYSYPSRPSTSALRAHRACDPAPSTQRRIPRLVSRRRLVDIRQGKLPALLLLARLAHRLSEVPFASSSFRQRAGNSGVAESRTGSDGRRRGSMYRESKNSPRTSGGRTGSQEAASCS
jgi:hypothetical protein